MRYPFIIVLEYLTCNVDENMQRDMWPDKSILSLIKLLHCLESIYFTNVLPTLSCVFLDFTPCHFIARPILTITFVIVCELARGGSVIFFVREREDGARFCFCACSSTSTTCSNIFTAFRQEYSPGVFCGAVSL